MFNKLTIAVLVILTLLGAYIGVASLAQLRAYDTEIVTLVSEINALKEQMHQLREEDRELYVKLDQTQKSLTKLQEESRIQEVLINEARVKRKR